MSSVPLTLTSLGISPNDMLNLQADQKLANNDLVLLKQQMFEIVEKVKQDLIHNEQAISLKRKAIEATAKPEKKVKLQNELEEKEQLALAYKNRVKKDIQDIVTAWQEISNSTPGTTPAVGVVRQHPVMPYSIPQSSTSSTSSISSSSSTTTASSLELTLTHRLGFKKEKKIEILNSVSELVIVMKSLSVQGFKQWLESNSYQLFKLVFGEYQQVIKRLIETMITSEKPINVRRQCLLMFLHAFKKDLLSDYKDNFNMPSSIWNALRTTLGNSMPPELLTRDIISALTECGFSNLKVMSEDQSPPLKIHEKALVSPPVDARLGFEDFKSLVENPSQDKLDAWIKKYESFEDIIFADEIHNEMLFFSVINKFGKCDNDDERVTIKRLYEMIHVKKLAYNTRREKTIFPLELVPHTLNLIFESEYFTHNFSNSDVVIKAWKEFKAELNEKFKKFNDCVSQSSVKNVRKWFKSFENVQFMDKHQSVQMIPLVISKIHTKIKPKTIKNRLAIYKLLIQKGCYQECHVWQDIDILDIQTFLTDDVIKLLARDENKMYQFLSSFKNALELFVHVKKRISSDYKKQV